jgi:drug/metabolite transporter (DMT)-like permease
MASGQESVVLAAFLLSATLAGGNAVGIRFSNRELDPLWGAGIRFSLAAIILLAVMAALRLRLPKRRALAGTLVFGALQFGGAFALVYYALVELHAGFGQIVLALVPLLTLLLVVIQRQERLRSAAIVGTVLALIGVVLMSRASLGESLPWLPLFAALGSALCMAQAAVVVRGFPPVNPVTMNALGMAAGAVLLLAGSALTGESLVVPRDEETWLAISYLVVAGSIGVFLLYLYVLRHWPASRATYAFVLIPFVTVVLSAWLDDEPVGLGLLFGGLLVLAGVYVGALRRQAGELAVADTRDRGIVNR